MVFMTMPFTVEQFLGVFVAYNARIWPYQIVFLMLGLVSVVALWREWLRSERIIPAILALMWAMNGIGYHFLFFATINPVATLFVVFFGIQAVLFAITALLVTNMRFEIGRDFRTLFGTGFITYAMIIYPLVGIWAGHGLMKGPMFGVAPCPTTIFTIGVLLMARGRWVAWLAIIPFLWSLVGILAVTQLEMLEDFVLPIAGVTLLIASFAGAARFSRRSSRACGRPRAHRFP
jgi:hypothetical protein